MNSMLCVNGLNRLPFRTKIPYVTTISTNESKLYIAVVTSLRATPRMHYLPFVKTEKTGT